MALECLADREKPGARAIHDALHARVLIEVSDPVSVLPPLPVLGTGESAAIRLALKLSVSVLMDEKAGRKIATNLRLNVIGSAGILVAAKKRGLIEFLRPMLEAFASNGYHFSDALVRATLMRAGER